MKIAGEIPKWEWDRDKGPEWNRDRGPGWDRDRGPGWDRNRGPGWDRDRGPGWDRDRGPGNGTGQITGERHRNREDRGIEAGLVKSADLLTPSELDAGSSAHDGNI